MFIHERCKEDAELLSVAQENFDGMNELFSSAQFLKLPIQRHLLKSISLSAGICPTNLRFVPYLRRFWAKCCGIGNFARCQLNSINSHYILAILQSNKEIYLHDLNHIFWPKNRQQKCVCTFGRQVARIAGM